MAQLGGGGGGGFKGGGGGGGGGGSLSVRGACGSVGGSLRNVYILLRKSKPILFIFQLFWVILFSFKRFKKTLVVRDCFTPIFDWC